MVCCVKRGFRRGLQLDYGGRGRPIPARSRRGRGVLFQKGGGGLGRDGCVLVFAPTHHRQDGAGPLSMKQLTVPTFQMLITPLPFMQ